MASSPLKTASIASHKVTLTIRSGPNKGESFQLLPPKVTIGRGPENDIILIDTKCSRAQAIIHVSPPRYFVEDVSSRGTTNVNGRTDKVIELRHGDVIEMGETKFEFRLDTQQALTASPPAEGQKNNQLRNYQAGPSPEARNRAPKQGNRARFYMIVGAVGFGLYLLLSQDASKKPDAIALKSTEEIEQDLQKTQEKLEKLAQTKEFRTPEEQQRFLEAHSHYLTGFRDYQKGQYARALRAFETARAIDPAHELANRYSVLAERKRDEWLTLQMMDGRRYLEKSMYSRCSAALDKVMDEIANPQDIKFKEARALKAECELMLKRKY